MPNSAQNSNKSNFGLLLEAGASVASRPDPNTLGVSDPYGTPTPLRFNDVSTAWTGQGVTAAFPDLSAQQLETETPKSWFALDPSVPGATVELRVWFYHKESGRWYTPFSSSSATYGGGTEDYVDYVEDVPLAPMYLEVVSISAGTVDIYVDPQNVEVL